MTSSPYMKAALLLSQIWETKKSIKTLAYDKCGELKVSKSAYAQVCHVLEHQRMLQALLQVVPISCRNEGLLYVLLYELLLGPNQKIRGGGALKREILMKESMLREILSSIHKSSATIKVVFPRYIRVNTLKCTLEDVVATFKAEDCQVYVDAHVPNLLVLKPATEIHEHKLVKEGNVILQDKSSCFSALCLIHGNKVPLAGDCLDACAAPGNKTSHLAALTNSKVYACDRNEKRLEMLDRRMELLVPNKRIVTMHVDFLKCKPVDYPNLKGILLDPSCSGSGIFTALDRLADNDDGTDRIEHLSNFQLTALHHAMAFDTVERIVYSTCSIHEQENELVVMQALRRNPSWELSPPYCLRDWKRRGRKVKGLTEEQTECLIRADRSDETNGFFVAYFERKDSLTNDEEISNVSDRRIIVPCGVAMYKGEFSVKADCTLFPESTQTTLKDALLEPALDTCASRNSDVVVLQSKISSQTTFRKDKFKCETLAESIVAKKQAKKMAWKRKQFDRKQERLLLKENSKS